MAGPCPLWIRTRHLQCTSPCLLPPIATIYCAFWHVRFWPIADISCYSITSSARVRDDRPARGGRTLSQIRRLQSSAREVLRTLCGELAVQQTGGLADLDEVAVRVPHVAADLRSAVD